MTRKKMPIIKINIIFLVEAICMCVYIVYMCVYIVKLLPDTLPPLRQFGWRQCDLRPFPHSTIDPLSCTGPQWIIDDVLIEHSLNSVLICDIHTARFPFDCSRAACSVSINAIQSALPSTLV